MQQLRNYNLIIALHYCCCCCLCSKALRGLLRSHHNCFAIEQFIRVTVPQPQQILFQSPQPHRIYNYQDCNRPATTQLKTTTASMTASMTTSMTTSMTALYLRKLVYNYQYHIIEHYIFKFGYICQLLVLIAPIYFPENLASNVHNVLSSFRMELCSAKIWYIVMTAQLTHCSPKGGHYGKKLLFTLSVANMFFSITIECFIVFLLCSDYI